MKRRKPLRHRAAAWFASWLACLGAACSMDVGRDNCFGVHTRCHSEDVAINSMSPPVASITLDDNLPSAHLVSRMLLPCEYCDTANIRFGPDHKLWFAAPTIQVLDPQEELLTHTNVQSRARPLASANFSSDPYYVLWANLGTDAVQLVMRPRVSEPTLVHVALVGSELRIEETMHMSERSIGTAALARDDGTLVFAARDGKSLRVWGLDADGELYFAQSGLNDDHTGWQSTGLPVGSEQIALLDGEHMWLGFILNSQGPRLAQLDQNGNVLTRAYLENRSEGRILDVKLAPLGSRGVGLITAHDEGIMVQRFERGVLEDAPRVSLARATMARPLLKHVAVGPDGALWAALSVDLTSVVCRIPARAEDSTCHQIRQDTDASIDYLSVLSANEALFVSGNWLGKLALP